MIEPTTVPLGQWASACGQAYADGYTHFGFLTAVDHLDDTSSPGIDVVLHVRHGRAPGDERWLETRWHEGLPLRSCTDLWPGAAWHEREIHEMFGVVFEGFRDELGEQPRPLLLPAGGPAHPLRKSFALPERDAARWPGAKDPNPRGGRKVRPLGASGEVRP